MYSEGEMNKRSKTAITLGALFLAIGMLWLSAIFIRSDGYLLWKKTAQTQSRNSAYQDLTGRLESLPIRKFLSEAFVVLFWVIACWELLCALLYLLSGISLIRAYPFRRQLTVLTLIADMILKSLIVAYQQLVILPLRNVFGEANILLAHFAPDGSFSSLVSVYLTGIKLIQPDALLYALFYAVLFIGLLCALVQPKTRKK